MFLKFLILGLLAYLFLVLIYSSLRRKGKSASDPSQGESMVLDPHCKSYVPKNEAYRSGDHYFCSEECARAYAAQQV